MLKTIKEAVTNHSSFVIAQSAEFPVREAYKSLATNGRYPRFLTPREMEILELMGKGLSMKGVARDLAISAGTVKWHVKNIYEKLGAGSREDALSKARLRQLID